MEINPWAFIRVSNEEITLEASLNSILGALDKGVIAYNDCVDNSEKIILDFCRKNKGFIPAKYPYNIYCPKINNSIGSFFKLYSDEELKSKYKIEYNLPPKNNRLSTYYNFALSFIPKNEWFVKIDCDHIYDAIKLKQAFSLIRDDYDAVNIPRVNVVIIDEDIYLELHDDNNVLYDVNDHLLIKNKNVCFIDAISSEKEGNRVIEAYDIGRDVNFIKTSLNNIHFPYLKKNRLYTYGKLIKLEDFYKTQEIFNWQIDKEILSKNIIFKYYNNFLM